VYSDLLALSIKLDAQDTDIRHQALLMTGLEERLTELEETVKILNLNLTNQATRAVKPTEPESAMLGSRTVDWRAKKKELEKKYSNRDKVREGLVEEIINSTDVLDK